VSDITVLVTVLYRFIVSESLQVTIVYEQGEEGCGYIADVPDLEACSAFGASPEEALAEVEKAKQAWLAAAREAGRPIPERRYRPAIYAP
jgi:predicted RNase H-like HicB family nuclease